MFKPRCSYFIVLLTIFIIYLCDLLNDSRLSHWPRALREGRAVTLHTVSPQLPAQCLAQSQHPLFV